MNKDTYNMLEQVKSLGITEEDAFALRRISMTLQRWFALECGDSNACKSWAIERDEKTEIPYLVEHMHVTRASGSLYSNSGTYRTRVADRETGARKRLDAIMKRYPKLRAYIQTDPRGCALYIIRPGDVPKGEDVSSCYSRGIAVYK